MAATQYDYSIQNDFPNHRVNSTRLTQEIQQSAIVIALQSIETSGDVCAIWFKDPLSVGDQAILDGIVATHSGDPLPYQPQGVALQTPAGVDVPTVSNVPMMLPNLFPEGVTLDLIGAGDDAITGRGNGAEFKLTGPANGADISLEWQYNDWVVMAGGGMNFDGALLGDNADMTITAPATVVTPSGGGNTGNCNLVDPGVGAAILIIPAPGNGTHDVDLAAAVPVPALGTGYYEWSEPDTGLGVTSAGTPGASTYNLFVIEIALTRYATKFQLLGSRAVNLTLPAVKPGKILPQWKSRVLLRSASQSQVKLCWFLITARMRTI